jgi:hypothetical protein
MGFIIDCKDTDPAAAARFWGEALGFPSLGLHGERYARLDGSKRDIDVEVQQVDHESRVHLDLESDDIDAEALRLEALGAERIEKVKSWWVMQAPTGQRFCICRAPKDLSNAPGVNVWP